MIRCKFKVVEKTEIMPWFNCGAMPIKVKLSPVQGEPFGTATPSGSMEMLILNDEASKELKIGKEYFIDITEVE